MPKRIILAMLLGFVFAGCDRDNDDDSSDTGTAGEESIYSGNYHLIGIECYHNTTREVTLAGPSVGFTVNVSIAGDDYSETIRDGDCTGTVTGTIEFRDDGSGTLSDTNVTRAEDGSCEVNGSFNLTDGEDSVTIPVTAVVRNGTTEGENFQFIRDEENGNIGITPFVQFSFPQNSTCFSIYEKD